MSRRLTYWTITVALAGFLFGFDTIVISGADEAIQKLWNTGKWFHGFFIMSMALWGTVIGAIFGGIPCEIFGRKKTLFWIGILYLVSALGSSMAPDPYLFSFFRFIGGLGVGASSVAAPIYISEIAPAKDRGKLVAAYQFNIVFGILLAFISNYLIDQYVGENSWRWMLGVEAIPAAIYSLMVLGVPNSPRWLILRKNDDNKAGELIKILDPSADVLEKIKRIKSSVVTKVKEPFFSGKYKKPLQLAFLIAFFNQLSGINFVLYYGPRILKESPNIGETLKLLAATPMGIVNLVFTLIGIYLIDKMGRRKLLTIGSIGYIITILGIAWAFYTNASMYVLVGFLSAFVAAHAIGQGAVIWVFISEIFPNKVRAQGMSFGAGTHWVFAALITLVSPVVLANFAPHQIFTFYAFMMMIQLIWVLTVMPETKGVPLEKLQKRLMDDSK